MRFDDRVTGMVSEFIKHGKIIHIDIDRTELNKNKTVTLPICADLKTALAQLTAVQPGDHGSWREYCLKLKVNSRTRWLIKKVSARKKPSACSAT